MDSFVERVKARINPERVRPLEAGLYSYTAPASDPLNYRLHLRIEPGGEGLLIINASTILHLNRTAAEYAYHLVEQTGDENVAEAMAERYRVNKNRAAQDYSELKERIHTLIETPDLDPVTYLDFERHQPYSDNIGAPYRLDCALTYQLPKGAKAETTPTKRVKKELSTKDWKQVIDKAWEAGIPHILFTGGEPTLRKDLVDLLQHAEEHGMVTGLLTDGIKLGDSKYLKALLDAGLDHAMIVLQPDMKNTWESLTSFSYWKDVLDDDIFVAAHLTIKDDNASKVNGLIDRLAESGVSAVSLSASHPSLEEALQAARAHADFGGLPLVWDLPVPYSAMNPVALELEAAKGSHPEGAGKAWLYVEPDGDVLPAQGVNKILGNMIKDEWETIWGKARN
ncbi:MAG: radical SAM protein [Chloroflexi bacterium]|nr:radical SAM protein [Chloroflexota bacterium]MQC26883.1 radical SAM protein [Chloroflexota bacterium]